MSYGRLKLQCQDIVMIIVR